LAEYKNVKNAQMRHKQKPKMFNVYHVKG